MDVSLIKKWEKFCSKAYKCPANVWTVGYGTTFLYGKNRKVQEGDAITESEASHELELYLKTNIFKKIDDVGPSLPERVKESLCSLSYNCGPSCLKSKNLLAAIESKDFNKLAAWFRQWVNVNGKPLQGLINRREDEIAHFKGYWP